MDIKLSKLQQHVQHNCHISDATHAGNYTLCIYLLKMREYYRWEHAMGFDDRIENDNIGKWLTERESLWETLEESPFSQLTIGDEKYEPFDIDGINDVLQKDNLVYSAGYILRGKPHFFLADIEQKHDHDEYQIIVSGREYARELSAPPALSQGSTIFIRSESLRRTVWEKVEESLWNKQQSPLVRAIACYDFKNNLQHLKEGFIEAIKNLRAEMDMPLQPRDLSMSSIDDVLKEAIKETGDLYPVPRYFSREELRALVLPLVSGSS